MKYKNMTNAAQKIVKEMVFDANVNIAGMGLLGQAVKKLSPSKENLKKFQLQFTGHPMCGCYSCIELSKIFVVSTPDIRESVIIESMKDLENGDF